MNSFILTNTEKTQAIASPGKYKSYLKANKLDYLIKSSTFVDSEGDPLPDTIIDSLLRNTDYTDILNLMDTNKKLHDKLSQEKFKDIIEEQKFKEIQSWISEKTGKMYTKDELLNLKTLMIRNKNLKTIPESIDFLSSLEKLHVANNDIQFLPKSIKNMKNLKILIILGNENLQKNKKKLSKYFLVY